MAAYDGRYNCFSEWENKDEQLRCYNRGCVETIYREIFSESGGHPEPWMIGVEICYIIIMGEASQYPQFNTFAWETSFRQMLNEMLNNSGYDDAWIADPNHTKAEYAEMAMTVKVDNNISYY
jgi:hypothetical protein